MRLAWVVGSGGLLGSALCRTLSLAGTTLFVPKERFSWTISSKLFTQITESVQSFASEAESADYWEIYWAAGTGTMSSRTETLATETQAIECLLKRLKADSRLLKKPGFIAYASSAGAIYAGSEDDVITEKTIPTPTTAYALEKLSQERLIHSFQAETENVTALVARISTLYGVGQSFKKAQGLLSHIARCLIRRHPVQIYVPYDTIRDYIFADDAAIAMVKVLRSTRELPNFLIKIIASERPATIAEIISIFKRLERRAPLIVTSASKLGRLYTRRVQFRSTVVPELTVPKKSLLIGVAQMMAAERTAFARAKSNKIF